MGGTPAKGDGEDEYTGLDRFGRVIDQQWINGGGVTDRFRYAYDADGNVTYREVDTASGTATGQSYDYDNLNRLTGYTVGTVTDTNGDGFPDSLSGGSGCQSWTLDQQGNWVSNAINGGTAQTRGINNQNQITSVSMANTPSYDNEGDMTEDENCHTYLYDAWDRMAASDSACITIMYDALGRRISDGTTGVTAMYYDSNGRVIEEQHEATVCYPWTAAQNVWSLAYQNALVTRDLNTDGADEDTSGVTGGLGKSSSGLDQRIYAQQDANWNVTALVDTSGTVQERYQYAPYGAMTITNGSFSSRGSTSYTGFDYYFQGGRLNDATGLYYFGVDDNGRDYSQTLGRWLETDHAGYVDGPNEFQLESSSPVVHVDPSGQAPTYWLFVHPQKNNYGGITTNPNGETGGSWDFEFTLPNQAAQPAVVPVLPNAANTSPNHPFLCGWIIQKVSYELIAEYLNAPQPATLPATTTRPATTRASATSQPARSSVFLDEIMSSTYPHDTKFTFWEAFPVEGIGGGTGHSDNNPTRAVPLSRGILTKTLTAAFYKVDQKQLIAAGFAHGPLEKNLYDLTPPVGLPAPDSTTVERVFSISWDANGTTQNISINIDGTVYPVTASSNGTPVTTGPAKPKQAVPNPPI